MREREYLRHRYRVVVAHVGFILGLVGVLMGMALASVLTAPPSTRIALGYGLPALACATIGSAAWRRWRDPEVMLSRGEGVLVVVLAWIVASLAAAVPLAITENLGASQAIFEAVSGWTTTGLSVLDPATATHATLLWRSLMQLAGGAGLAIVMLAAATPLGSPSLAAAEGRAELLAPHVRASTLLVLRIYVAEAVLGSVALWAVGMTPFDAINHSCGAVSTGGFSTRGASIGAWDSAAIEGVLMVLMILGSMNFVTLWCMIRGRWRAVSGNGEVRLAALVMPIAAGVLFLATVGGLYGFGPRGVRIACFEAVSALTTTGYSTVSYAAWNAMGTLVLILLMIIGGATCSTAGGVKQYRIHLLWRGVVQELRRAVRPARVVSVDGTWEGGELRPITDASLKAAGVFLFLYLTTWVLGAMLVVAQGVDAPAALFEFASALGTVGLSVGVTGPHTSSGVLWVEIVGMLLGRLEFFVLLAGLARLGRHGIAFAGGLGARRGDGAD